MPSTAFTHTHTHTHTHTVLLERGVMDPAAFQRALGGYSGDDTASSDTEKDEEEEGGEDSEEMPHFTVGQRVRVRRDAAGGQGGVSRSRWRKPHLRTPGYIFGAEGVVERACGVFKDPEFLYVSKTETERERERERESLERRRKTYREASRQRHRPVERQAERH